MLCPKCKKLFVRLGTHLKNRATCKSISSNILCNFNRDIPPFSPADIGQHTVQFDSCPDELLCTTDEVFSLIKSLDSSKANGPDGVSSQMLKATAYSIVPSLTKLFNIFISQGCCLDCWKTSTVVPIPKNANHKQVSNYRPISLLSIVSKMLERQHLYITNHLNEHHPLSNKQWGSSLASPQLQLSSPSPMTGSKHSNLDKKCVPSFLITKKYLILFLIAH